MKWYCDKCRTMHSDDEMCPKIQIQLREHPKLLTEATTFATIAGEYELVSSNALDSVAQTVNKLVGTNFSYEGTHQYARDIHVFRRLNEETFVNAGHFSTPEAAKEYLRKIEEKDGLLRHAGETDGRKFGMKSFDAKLTGAGQEVDWLRYKQAKLSSIYEKSSLLNKNAAGVDGETINRFTGKGISRTTVKASIHPMDKNSTGIKDVMEAIEKKYATSDDIIFASDGAANAAHEAGLTNPVIEMNSSAEVRASNERLKNKIHSGDATTAPTLNQVGQNVAQGAVVAAAVELTISSITNYVRYKNGEISIGEALREVGESVTEGAITGGALGGISLFIPGGTIGFVGGMAIGIYVRTTTKNVLNEVFGKGFYEQVLHASGYIYGTSISLREVLEEISAGHQTVRQNIKDSEAALSVADSNIDAILAELGGARE